MELACNDKLAKDKNGVKNQLVPQDLFGRSVDAKGMKAKDFKRTVCAFSTLSRKKIEAKKFDFTRGWNFL